MTGGAGEDPSSIHLGLTVIEAEDGRARVRMSTRHEHVNGAGVVHGGLIFQLADTALAVAVQSTGAEGLTATADVVFLAPVAEGVELEAEARVVRRSGRSVLADATLLSAGVVVAEVRATFRLRR